MNICFFSAFYNIGGGERNLVDVSVSLKKNGNRVCIIIPQLGQLSDILKEKDIEYFCVGNDPINRRWIWGFPIFIDFRKYYKIRRFFKDKKFVPHVVHSNSVNSIPLSFLIATYYNVKCEWTCHGPWEIPSKFQGKFLEKMLDKVISITPEVYDGIYCKNRVMIPLGINDENVENKADYKQKEIKKILCVARFQYIKGQDILVKAFRIISGKMSNVELHFFGGTLTGCEEDELFYHNVRDLVSKYMLTDKVFFHGFKANVRSVMNQYDIISIPSRYESFSMTVLEGLNRGMCVVAPNIGGPKFIIENNKSGYLYRANNIEDLAEKCLFALSDNSNIDKRDIIKRGRCFSSDVQAERLMNLYNDSQ